MFQNFIKKDITTNYAVFRNFYDEFIKTEALPQDYKQVDRYVWTSLKVKDLINKKKLQPSPQSNQILNNAVNNTIKL